jgi:hypothetical protein
VDLRVCNHRALEGLGYELYLRDHCLQVALDHLSAVERIHHQHRVGAVEQILVFDPAIAVIERHEHAVVNAGANP